jgi:biotin transport system substrate-specific component
LIIERFGKSFAALMAAMYAGWAVVYVLGTLWYMYLARVGLVPALLVCVVPFLLGDAVKTVLCATLINRLSERGLLRDEL